MLALSFEVSLSPKACSFETRGLASAPISAEKGLVVLSSFQLAAVSLRF